VRREFRIRNEFDGETVWHGEDVTVERDFTGEALSCEQAQTNHAAEPTSRSIHHERILRVMSDWMSGDGDRYRAAN
jgi:hypothetical protein